MSAPGPVPDKREPDLCVVAGAAAAKDKENEESDDITEMEPPNAEEIDEAREQFHYIVSMNVIRLCRSARRTCGPHRELFVAQRSNLYQLRNRPVRRSSSHRPQWSEFLIVLVNPFIELCRSDQHRWSAQGDAHAGEEDL